MDNKELVGKLTKHYEAIIALPDKTFYLGIVGYLKFLHDHRESLVEELDNEKNILKEKIRNYLDEQNILRAKAKEEENEAEIAKVEKRLWSFKLHLSKSVAYGWLNLRILEKHVTNLHLIDLIIDGIEKKSFDNPDVIKKLHQYAKELELSFSNKKMGNQFPDGTSLLLAKEDFIQYLTLVHFYVIAQLQKDIDKIIHPSNRDFYYENFQLHIKLQDQSWVTLDLTNADTLRPVFETFYYLQKESNKHLFTVNEILNKYKELTHHEIPWFILTKRKSTIMGKMIKPKLALKKRVIWMWDKQQKAYHFQILPLSD